MMADGSFLWGYGLNLHHLQYECLGLLSIWNRHLYLGISLFRDINNAMMGYLWDPLHHYGMMAAGNVVRGHGLNLYWNQIK